MHTFYKSIHIIITTLLLMPSSSYKLKWSKCLISSSIILPIFFNHIQPSFASREIGNIPATGLIFKDYLKVNAFEDPKIKGVTIYVSDFDRPITEKLSKDFFDDPSTSSLSCAQTGPITISQDINRNTEGEEVFEEARNLFFKTIRVRRVYDEKTNTIVYASYSTRFNIEDKNKSRYKSSLCAVHINN